MVNSNCTIKTLQIGNFLFFASLLIIQIANEVFVTFSWNISTIAKNDKKIKFEIVNNLFYSSSSSSSFSSSLQYPSSAHL